MSARAASISGRRSITTSATSSRTASSTSSSWRWRTCAPTTSPAAAAPDRSRTSAPGTGTNPLPIYLAYLNGRRDADNPAAYTGGAQTWTNTTLAGRLVHTNPNPNFVSSQTSTATNANANAAGDLDNNLTFRNNALAAGLPANFFVVNPHADDGERHATAARSAPTTRCRSSCAGGCRTGLSFNGSYQYALEEGSEFLGFHFGRASSRPTRSIRHAIKAQWDWTIPVRPRRALWPQHASVLNAIVGGWQFNGAGRFQAAHHRTSATCGWSGMTKADAQKLYKFEIRPDPQTGLPTVFAFPDDVILNTRRAFSVSATNPNGYSDLGVPEGRYFAPANSADCIQLKAGDCAPRAVVLLAPWFTRFDIGVTKRIRHRRQQEHRVPRRRAQRLRQHQFHGRPTRRARRAPAPASSRPTRPIAIWTTPTIRAAGSDSSRFDSTGSGKALTRQFEPHRL